jgi:Gluconate 2-dehydrogenase subunit 3
MLVEGSTVKQKKRPSRGVQLDRRGILKLLGAVPGAALISAAPLAKAVAEAASGTSAVPPSSTSYQPKVFDSHQWKTLHVLCDSIIPADQKSDGAVQAGVPEFIDDWLDFQRGSLPAQIQGGLTWLDLECNRLFRRDFVDCADDQQKQILDRIAYPQKAAAADSSAVIFFNRLRDLVVSGYFTSQAGIKALPYLGNEPQSEWNGCPAPVLAKLGLAKDKAST